MKISTSIKFYMLAAFIAVIGAVDIFFVNTKENEKPAAETTATQTDTAYVPQCFGREPIVIGYKPVATSDVNDPASDFIRDIVESTLRSAGCDVTRSNDWAQLDLLIDRPAGIKKLVDEQKWLETGPYAVVQLKTIGATPVEQLEQTKEIHIDGQWQTLIKDRYPGKILVVSEHPVDDVVNPGRIYSAIVGRSAPDSPKTTHHTINVDIPLTMALNPSRQQILDPLNRLLASADHAKRFSASEKKNPDIIAPPK